MTGLFSNSIKAMSEDIREATASISNSLKELTESMRKLVEKRKGE